MKYQLNNPLGDEDGTKNKNRRVKKHMDGKLKKITTDYIRKNFKILKHFKIVVVVVVVVVVVDAWSLYRWPLYYYYNSASVLLVMNEK